MFSKRPPDVSRLRRNTDIKGLVKALNYKEDPNIRKAAAEALGEIGDARTLILVGKKKKGYLCDASKYSGLLHSAAFEEDISVKKSAANAIVMFGESAIDILIGVLKPPIFQPQIISNDERVAAWALGEIGDPKGLKALLHALARGVDEAPDAIIKLGDQALSELHHILDAQLGNHIYRGKIIELLGKIGSRRTVVPLLKAMKQDSDNQYLADRILDKISKEREVNVYSCALKDQYWIVRIAAAEKLGKVKDKQAIFYLKAALDDEVQEVRDAIEKAILNIQESCDEGDPINKSMEIGKPPLEIREPNIVQLELFNGKTDESEGGQKKEPEKDE